VLSWGQNCMGQVGVGLDISERKKPTVLKELDGLTITQAVAGGMHSAVLTDDGKVFFEKRGKKEKKKKKKRMEGFQEAQAVFFCPYWLACSSIGVHVGLQ
jgi:alpha-tubulin suppressor-like RCC1 family protein